MVDVLHEENCLCYPVRQFTRAFFLRDGESGEANVDASLLAGKRKQMGRKRRRLEEQGRLEFRRLTAGEAQSVWVEQFLRLEASGWKAERGTAMLCLAHEAEYFRDICKQYHAEGQLRMAGLFLNDRPIAMKCSLMSQEGGFVLKIAYDETYRKWSPGLMLEIEDVLHLNDSPSWRWMDSCAEVQSVFDIWVKRRTISHFLIAPGKLPGNLLLASIPLLHMIKRKLRKQHTS
jgi:hypothetical protein